MNKPITAGQQAFLDAYRYSGMVKEAAAQVGCSRELHYGAMRTSETYREAFASVQRDLSYELEEEARRRAIDGVKIPVIYQGKVIGYDIRYSDALLVFLLEANDPEKFGGIQKELARNKDGFCVRWDREGTGRPRRPTMNVPQPPKPPRPPMPPRPPRPPVGECSEPVTYAEWVAARGYTDDSERGPIDPETLARWVTGDNLGPAEWVPEEAGTGFVSEDTDVLEEEAGWGSDESDAGLCVRWGEPEPARWDRERPNEVEEQPEEGAALDGRVGGMESSNRSELTPRQSPGAFRKASTHPTGLLDRHSTRAARRATTVMPVSVSGGPATRLDPTRPFLLPSGRALPFGATGGPRLPKRRPPFSNPPSVSVRRV